MNQKCHFRIYIKDEQGLFTVPLYKDNKVLVFKTLGDASRYAQKEAGLKTGYRIK